MDRSEPWNEDGYRVETPEQVDVEFDVARLGSRLIAAILDTIILAVACPLLAFLTIVGLTALFGAASAAANLSPLEASNWAFAIGLLVGFVTFWGYYVFFELIWQGQSPGKRRAGLRVIREGGYPIGFVGSAVRNLVRIVDFLPYGYALGAVVMLIDRRSRRLGDLAAGTLVVKERRELKAATLGSYPDPEPAAAWTSGPDGPSEDDPIDNLDRLTSEDQSLLREYLLRRATLADAAAVSLAGHLAAVFARRLGHDLAGEAPDVFLSRLSRQLSASCE